MACPVEHVPPGGTKSTLTHIYNPPLTKSRANLRGFLSREQNVVKTVPQRVIVQTQTLVICLSAAVKPLADETLRAEKRGTSFARLFLARKEIIRPRKSGWA